MLCFFSGGIVNNTMVSQLVENGLQFHFQVEELSQKSNYPKKKEKKSNNEIENWQLCPPLSMV